MNILICSFSFPAPSVNHFGGKFILGEAIAYAENGANVHVLTPWIHGAEKREDVHPRVSVHRFNYFFPRSQQRLLKPNEPLYNQKSWLALLQIPFIFLAFFFQIFKHAFRADIIHAQWTVTALLALIPKWLLGKKVVLTARGSDLRLLPKWLNQFIHSQVDGAIDCFGPQPWNEQYKSEFSASFIKLPLIVYNDSQGGVPDDIREILDQKPEALIILYIGRFERLKITNSNLPLLDLISSCKILAEQQLDFHVFYIGDGELLNEMKQLIVGSNLEGVVSLLGPKTNVFDYIRYCHLGAGGVAFNGVSEEFTVAGVPQILVEGGANSGTPWVDQINTVFFEGGDAADLADKLTWAINNRDVLKAIGQNAKLDMEDLITDTQRGGKAYITQFQKLLDRNLR